MPKLLQSADLFVFPTRFDGFPFALLEAMAYGVPIIATAIIEHLIRVVKIWRIAQERFRLNTQHYETAILAVCGLVRVRLGRYELGHLIQS